MAVLATIQDNWRTVLSRVFARDIADAHAEITYFKIGEGGFVNLPPKEPVAPDAARSDLESEGTDAPSGGTATFTSGSALVSGVGTSFLADLSPGDWIKPGPTPSASSGSAGVIGSEIDTWGQVLTVDGNLQVTLTAPYAGPTTAGRAVRVAPEPYYTFRKAVDAGNATFINPNITEITTITGSTEANSDQLGNNPEFFELGLFDSNGVMVVYVTYDAQTKINGVQLNHIVQILT